MQDIIDKIEVVDDIEAVKLKGHTKIELRDVNTGKIEVIESDNLVTDGIVSWVKNYGQPLGGLYGADAALCTDMLWRTLLGGIYLFNETIPTTAKYAPGSARMTGNSYVDAANGGVPVELGSFNTAESSWTRDQVVLVYDWNTAQGNGTINSVCLGTAMGGRMGYGNMSAQRQSSTPVPLRMWDYHLGEYSRELTYDNSRRIDGSYSSFYHVNNMVSLYDDNWYVLMSCHRDGNYDYFDVSNIPSGTTEIRIYHAPLNYKMADIFYRGNESGRVQNLTWGEYDTLTVPSANYTRYIKMAGPNYGSGACVYWVEQAGGGKTPSGSSVSVTVVDLPTATMSNIMFNNNSGWPVQFATQCHLIDDHRVITYIEDEVNGWGSVIFDYVQGTVLYRLANGWYDSYSSNNRAWCFYMTLDRIIAPNTAVVLNLSDYSEPALNMQETENMEAPVYCASLDKIFDRYSYWYSNSGYTRICLKPNPWRLMTINNLPQPVVKTPSKTMKVTYTLTRATT